MRVLCVARYGCRLKNESKVKLDLKYISLILPLVCLAVMFVSCNKQSAAPTNIHKDTTQMLLTTIHECSKLYTVEYDIHKVVLHEDTLKVNGKFLQHDFSIDVPQSTRHIAIPMDPTIKAYIDMSTIGEQQIVRRDSQIVVLLPTPQAVLTSSQINHSEVKQYVALFGKKFSDAELSSYEKQGREAIVEDMPQQQIKADAMQAAVRLLVPMLERMGYAEKNIRIVYRDPSAKVTMGQIEDKTTIEHHE